ncbi:transglutaminase-like cysteine protease [Desulfuromonas soudanensis]|uniref:Transglutaminase-like cysteine protease n=1 Tax=Desulfuromonas soudanensis TaxID=1603606 RepID=A0A0M4D3J6_9BACT|nr:transglutaminase domain-containing protein [Desulfuromonas soudanensis]ALC17784.1 transglutaminase-like cysteine protease [Desulfuromonas soudanensis]
MKRLFTLFLTLLAALAGTCALAASQGGTVTQVFDLSARTEPGETRLWIPYPVSDANQVVSAVRIDGDYAEAAVYTDRVFRTPMLFARWADGAKSRKLTFAFAVERQEVIRRDFPAREGAWDPADYAPYLEATALGPIDGAVKVLADRITRGQGTVAGKARAIYDWTCDNMYRDPKTRGCGPGDVCTLLTAPGGKCADIHSVFVALARAAGVPAREVFGIRQGKGSEEEITGWQHCWAEFFLPGYGWVPVDPADVRKKMLTENLAPESPEAAEYRAYFWGGIDPYRIALGHGRDLTLNPPQQGAPVNYLMYPYAEIGATTLDWLDPKTFGYRITWRPH